MSRYLIIVVLAMFVAIPRICAQSQVRMALPKTQTMVHNSDLRNNQILYTYVEQENHYRLTKVAYNGASVEFQYQMTLPVWLYPLILVQLKEM
jgi:biopolymer transport protein ExbD